MRSAPNRQQFAMKLDPDARPFIGIAAAPAVVAVIGGRWRLAAVLMALPAAIAAFFRDPDRAPDLGIAADLNEVLAPADGRVLHVGPPQPGVAPPGEWQQVSIFLSLTDVHINRTPIGGTVRAASHRRGRSLAAFRAASAHENERSELEVVTSVDGEERVVIFRQVVGVAARRVVTRVGVGDDLVAGERIGLMRFGSRMDVFVPPQVVLLVAVGDRTVAGASVIGRWPGRQT